MLFVDINSFHRVCLMSDFFPVVYTCLAVVGINTDTLLWKYLLTHSTPRMLTLPRGHHVLFHECLMSMVVVLLYICCSMCVCVCVCVCKISCTTAVNSTFSDCITSKEGFSCIQKQDIQACCILLSLLEWLAFYIDGSIEEDTLTTV